MNEDEQPERPYHKPEKPVLQLQSHIFAVKKPAGDPVEPWEDWSHVILNAESDGRKLVDREEVILEETAVGHVSWETGEPEAHMTPNSECVFIRMKDIQVPPVPFSDQ